MNTHHIDNIFLDDNSYFQSKVVIVIGISLLVIILYNLIVFMRETYRRYTPRYAKLKSIDTTKARGSIDILSATKQDNDVDVKGLRREQGNKQKGEAFRVESPIKRFGVVHSTEICDPSDDSDSDNVGDDGGYNGTGRSHSRLLSSSVGYSASRKAIFDSDIRSVMRFKYSPREMTMNEGNPLSTPATTLLSSPVLSSASSVHSLLSPSNVAGVSIDHEEGRDDRDKIPSRSKSKAVAAMFPMLSGNSVMPSNEWPVRHSGALSLVDQVKLIADQDERNNVLIAQMIERQQKLFNSDAATRAAQLQQYEAEDKKIREQEISQLRRLADSVEVMISDPQLPLVEEELNSLLKQLQEKISKSTSSNGSKSTKSAHMDYAQSKFCAGSTFLTNVKDFASKIRAGVQTLTTAIGEVSPDTADAALSPAVGSKLSSTINRAMLQLCGEPLFLRLKLGKQPDAVRLFSMTQVLFKPVAASAAAAPSKPSSAGATAKSPAGADSKPTVRAASIESSSGQPPFISEALSSIANLTRKESELEVVALDDREKSYCEHFVNLLSKLATIVVDHERTAEATDPTHSKSAIFRMVIDAVDDLVQSLKALRREKESGQKLVKMVLQLMGVIVTSIKQLDMSSSDQVVLMHAVLVQGLMMGLKQCQLPSQIAILLRALMQREFLGCIPMTDKNDPNSNQLQVPSLMSMRLYAALCAFGSPSSSRISSGSHEKSSSAATSHLLFDTAMGWKWFSRHSRLLLTKLGQIDEPTAQSISKELIYIQEFLKFCGHSMLQDHGASFLEQLTKLLHHLKSFHVVSDGVGLSVSQLLSSVITNKSIRLISFQGKNHFVILSLLDTSTGALSEVKRLSSSLASLGESQGHRSEVTRLLNEIQIDIDSKAFNKLVATDSSIQFVVDYIVKFLGSVSEPSLLTYAALKLVLLMLTRAKRIDLKKPEDSIKYARVVCDLCRIRQDLVVLFRSQFVVTCPVLIPRFPEEVVNPGDDEDSKKDFEFEWNERKQKWGEQPALWVDRMTNIVSIFAFCVELDVEAPFSAVDGWLWLVRIINLCHRAPDSAPMFFAPCVAVFVHSCSTTMHRKFGAPYMHVLKTLQNDIVPKLDDFGLANVQTYISKLSNFLRVFLDSKGERCLPLYEKVVVDVS